MLLKETNFTRTMTTITTYQFAAMWGAVGAVVVKPGVALISTRNLGQALNSVTGQFQGANLWSTLKAMAGGAVLAMGLQWLDRATPASPILTYAAYMGGGLLGSMFVVPTIESLLGRTF